MKRLAGGRLVPLFIKELRQIKRDWRLVISLVLPPTVQLIIFGFALNPQVTDLRLGVVDESRTASSREVVSAFVESRSFQIKDYYPSTEALGQALSRGELQAGLVIPSDFATRRDRRETAEVQFLLDAVDSNTSGIAGGYASRIIASFNQRAADTPAVTISGEASATATGRGQIAPRVALLFNPGLENSWFITTGILGVLLVLNGSIVASASMVKEKEVGTIEQLLMTPAVASEIITAKIAPLFLLLAMDIGLAIVVGYVVFGVPVRGSLVTLYGAGALCVFAGIGIGTFIATFSRSQQQAQLIGFFVNPPLSLLSGATTPIEAIPEWLQPFTYLNPIRHFASIARGVMIKGAGIDVLYPNLLALLAIAVLLVGVSAWRFRKQLG
jgi:ABC-2 type transport system permease protein